MGREEKEEKRRQGGERKHKRGGKQREGVKGDNITETSATVCGRDEERGRGKRGEERGEREGMRNCACGAEMAKRRKRANERKMSERKMKGRGEQVNERKENTTENEGWKENFAGEKKKSKTES